MLCLSAVVLGGSGPDPSRRWWPTHTPTTAPTHDPNAPCQDLTVKTLDGGQEAWVSNIGCGCDCLSADEAATLERVVQSMNAIPTIFSSARSDAMAAGQTTRQSGFMTAMWEALKHPMEGLIRLSNNCILDNNGVSGVLDNHLQLGLLDTFNLTGQPVTSADQACCSCGGGTKPYATRIEAVEVEALKDLYNSLGGDHWSNSAGWEAAAGFLNPCDMSMFRCDAAGNLFSLLLGFNNISGTLPRSLGVFSTLQIIMITPPDPIVQHLFDGFPEALSRNLGIQGTIPSSVGMLTALKMLMDLQFSRLLQRRAISGTLAALPPFSSFLFSNISGTLKEEFSEPTLFAFVYHNGLI